MIPAFLLNNVYTRGSLKNASGGVRFELVNRLADIDWIAMRKLAIDREPVPLDSVQIEAVDVGNLAPRQIDCAQPFSLPLNTTVTILVLGRELRKARHEIEIAFETRSFGYLQFAIEDDIAEDAHTGGEIDSTPVEEPRPQQETSAVDPWESGIKLLTSSIDAYVECQKKLLNVAIQQFEPETIAGDHTAEAARNVIAEITPPLIDVAQKSALNLVAAGKLFLDLATKPAGAPGEPVGPCTPRKAAGDSKGRKSDRPVRAESGEPPSPGEQ
jgi:hypothetical protein